MAVQFTENKLIKLFIEIDDLLIAFKKYQEREVRWLRKYGHKNTRKKVKLVP